MKVLEGVFQEFDPLNRNNGRIYLESFRYLKRMKRDERRMRIKKFIKNI
jgi:hypothetical protein